jgi:DNA replication initiation complex subunit (GINS family)
MVNLITFQFIRQIQKQEKENKQLIKLDNNFYNDANHYLNFKKTQKTTTDTELKHTKLIIEDIKNTRLLKILNSATIYIKTKITPQNLLENEEQFFQNIITEINNFKNNINEIKNETKDTNSKKSNTTKHIKLKILNETPEFIAEDGNNYGPYKKNELVHIPKEAADILIMLENAKYIN